MPVPHRPRPRHRPHRTPRPHATTSHRPRSPDEARFSPAGLTLALQCADTDTDGLVILGGEATADAGDSAVGDRVAVIIREGDPDGAILWYELPLPEGEVAAGSCREFLDPIPHDQFTGDNPLADIAEGDDIETG